MGRTHVTTPSFVRRVLQLRGGQQQCYLSSYSQNTSSIAIQLQAACAGFPSPSCISNNSFQCGLGEVDPTKTVLDASPIQMQMNEIPSPTKLKGMLYQRVELVNSRVL